MSTEVAPHLGGYLSGPHGDEATWFPELWTWMVERFEATRIIDIGCGEGHSTRFFESLIDCGVVGIDGVPQDNPLIRQHDFSEGTWEPRGSYDLGWCCEFVEHLEERFLPNLIPTFQACSYIAMTHAFPGQLGYHHVNCREPEYWLGFMSAIGFKYERGLTQQARAVAAFNENEYNHFVRSGLVFSRQ